jgi:hypothetical protein
MYSFLAFLGVQPKLPASLDERVRSASRRALGPYEDVRCESWSSRDGLAHLWVWTNEPPGLNANGDHATSGNSAVVRLGNTVHQPQALLATAGRSSTALIDKISTSAGDCTIFHYDGENRSALAASTLTRHDNLSYAKDGGCLLFSNRSLIIHLIKNHGNLAFSEIALTAFFSNSWNQGGFLCDQSQFAGVDLAPPNAIIRARLSGAPRRPSWLVKTEDYRNAYRQLGRSKAVPDRQYYAELAEMLVETVAPLARFSDPMIIGLTGGKDSRVVASALKAAGVLFSTGTSGADSDPDVIIGKQLAKFLGVEHIQIKPNTVDRNDGRRLQFDARRNIARGFYFTDGGIFPLPALPRRITNPLPGGFKPDTVTLSTQGAELWRGGYISRDFSWVRPEASLTDVTSEMMRKEAAGVWFANLQYVRDPYRVEFRRWVKRWLREAGIDDHPAAIPEKFYLSMEMGRRVAAWHYIQQANSFAVRPFSEQRLLHKIYEVAPEFRRDDHLHFNVISHLAPGLAKFPLGGKRWGFEWEKPRSEADREAWLARSPLPVTPQSYGGWRMCTAVGADYWKAFHDEIFCYGPSENVWSFLDRVALLKLFRSDEILDARTSSMFWTIYAISVLLSGEWLAGDVPERIIESRFERPWGTIYAEALTAISSAQDAARQRLVSGLAAWLKAVSKPALDPFDGWYDSDLENLAELQPQPIFVQSEQASAPHAADPEWQVPSLHGAAGAGRRLLLRTGRRDCGASWEITIAAEPETPRANSYLVIPLPQFDNPERQPLDLRFRACAEHPASAISYLAVYLPAPGGRKRVDIASPPFRYSSELQPVRWRIEVGDVLLEGPPRPEYELLVGLPDDTNALSICDLEVSLPPSVDRFSELARAINDSTDIVQDAINGAVSYAKAKHQLSSEDVSHLAAVLEPPRNGTMPDHFDLRRFASWLWNAANRRSSLRYPSSKSNSGRSITMRVLRRIAPTTGVKMISAKVVPSTMPKEELRNWVYARLEASIEHWHFLHPIWLHADAIRTQIRTPSFGISRNPNAEQYVPS